MSFADLHRADLPLLLPNAWDVPSALGFVAAGFPAIGTTSLGVAASLGLPDGSRATREANLRLADDLRRLPVFVSLDVEDGYADDPAEVAAYVADLADRGVDGVNLEDSTAERLVEPAAFAAKVGRVKERCPDLFVNARVDTYWLHQDETLDATLTRATAYVDAGADGIFVPGTGDPEVLRTIADALPVPLNALPVPGVPLAEHGRWGVRRVSTGSLPYRTALAAAARSVDAVRDGLDLPAAVAYADLQAALAGHAASP